MVGARWLLVLVLAIAGFGQQADWINNIKNKPVVDVRLYATGDGTVDDTSAIAAAIKASTAGDILYFPLGTYIASTITINKALTLEGPGTIKQKTSSAVASTPFITASAAGVALRGLTIDGNSANQGVVTGADLLVYTNGADNGRVQDCVFQNSTGEMIVAYGVTDFEVSNNRFSNWEAGNHGAILIANDNAATSVASYRVRILNNHVDGSVSDSSGIIVHGTPAYPIYDVTAQGNTVLVGDYAAEGTLGIEYWSTAQYGIFGGVISGNTVSGPNTTNTNIFGISVAGAGVDTGAVTGNTVRDCRLYGIELAASNRITVSGNAIYTSAATPILNQPGITLNETSNSSVTGNTISGYEQGVSLYSQNFITTHVAYNTVSGNVIKLPAGEASRAIWVQSNNAASVITSNIISGNLIYGDDTASQVGVSLQLDSGEISNTTVAFNEFRDLPLAINHGLETYTHQMMNRYESCTVTEGGVAGTGRVKAEYDSVNGTFQIYANGDPLAVVGPVMSGYSGQSAAATGFLRFKQDDYLMFRNEADDGDVAGIYKADNDVVYVGGALGIGVSDTRGIGNGVAGNVQALAKGTGTGPTTPGTVNQWFSIYVSGVKYWIPLMQ